MSMKRTITTIILTYFSSQIVQSFGHRHRQHPMFMHDHRRRQVYWVLMGLPSGKGWVSCLALLVILLFGCVTLPSRIPIESIHDIKGTWHGTVGNSKSDSYEITITIKEDGSYAGMGETGFNAGDLRVADGRARWVGATSEGTMTLTEAEGRQVLDLMSDGGLRGRLARLQ
jgi:hypothetical protein